MKQSSTFIGKPSETTVPSSPHWLRRCEGTTLRPSRLSLWTPARFSGMSCSAGASSTHQSSSFPYRSPQPGGVVPQRQRQGIASALIRHGLYLLDQRGVPLVFLEGDPGYYSRLGFRRGDALSFRKPSLRVPDAAFQVIALTAYEPWMTGTLVYASTFWDLDCVGLRDDEQ